MAKEDARDAWVARWMGGISGGMGGMRLFTSPEALADAVRVDAAEHRARMMQQFYPTRIMFRRSDV
jgi:hypothetical protein